MEFVIKSVLSSEDLREQDKVFKAPVAISTFLSLCLHVCEKYAIHSYS